MSTQKIGDQLHNILINKDSKLREKEIFDFIRKYSLQSRVNIAAYYNITYGNLYKDIQKQLSGDFSDLIYLLFLPPTFLDSKLLEKAMKGFSVNDEVIIEILTSRDNDFLKKVFNVYKDETGKEFIDDLKKIYSGYFLEALLTLISTSRSVNSRPDFPSCSVDAQKLAETDGEQWIRDPDIFRGFWASRSPHEMVVTCRIFMEKTGKNMIDEIEKRLSGKNKMLIKEILYNTCCPHELFAEKIKESISGLGTDEHKLNRILATRCDIDMSDIKDFYFITNNEDMTEAIKEDTSGIYQELCMYLSKKK